MLQSITTHRSLPRFAWVAALVAAIALIATAAWIGFSPHRATHPGGGSPDATVNPSSGLAWGTAPALEGTGLPATSDAEQFSRAVAVAVFGWNTSTASGPAELVEPFMTVADPTGESSAGLASDLYGYLPTVEAWATLRQYETRQWLVITSLSIPELWATAVEQGSATLAPGTTAYTVTGVRHRAGMWEGEPVSSEHEVAFTVFVVCGPTYPECHLLRLSRLDNPLR